MRRRRLDYCRGIAGHSSGLVRGWCARRRVGGRWRGRIGGLKGYILVGGVEGSIGPCWPERGEVWGRRELGYGA